MKALVRAVAVIVLLNAMAAAAHAGGAVQGAVWLKTDDGTVFFADYLRILLVREEIEVPALSHLDELNKFERMEAIRTAHVDFFIHARSKLAEDGFVVATTMTTPEGRFVFDNVYPGNYFILVTFPAMVRTYKVAWQVPVTVKENETVSVELNNGNMVLPTYSR